MTLCETSYNLCIIPNCHYNNKEMKIGKKQSLYSEQTFNMGTQETGKCMLICNKCLKKNFLDRNQGNYFSNIIK